MACNANTCQPQGTAIPAVTPTSWTDTSLTNVRPKLVHITELRSAINTERSRRSLTAITWTNATSLGDILATHFSEIKTAIDQCRTKDGLTAFTWSVNFVSKSSITSSEMNQLRTNTNTLQSTCVCNCNYCTCNCNYCTCNCNYCTCNCNYCTCNCNYKCTCNCNYRTSDRRLKIEIEYI